jgi:hypothetical protein
MQNKIRFTNSVAASLLLFAVGCGAGLDPGVGAPVADEHALSEGSDAVEVPPAPSPAPNPTDDGELIAGVQVRVGPVVITQCVPVAKLDVRAPAAFEVATDPTREERTYAGRPVVTLSDERAAIAKQEASEVYLGRRAPTAVTTLLACDDAPCACPPPSYVLGHFIGEGPGTPCAVNVRPCPECAPPHGNGVCAEIVWWDRGEDGRCHIAQGPDVRPCDRGCFSAETRIQMANGKPKLAREIRVGDRVWNPVRRRAAKVARVIVGPEQKPLVEVRTAKETLIVTQMHPMHTARGLVAASDLRPTDRLRDARGRFVRIVSLAATSLRAHENVWNFRLAGGRAPRDHYLVANGVVTGDLYLQEVLNKRRALRDAVSAK